MRVYTSYASDYTLFWATVVEAMGHELLYLGEPGRDVVDLAARYAPESWCYDVKLVLGDLIRGTQNGADVILSPGGENNCLLGHVTVRIFPDIIKEAAGRAPQFVTYNLAPETALMAGAAARPVPKGTENIKKLTGMGSTYREIADMKKVLQYDGDFETLEPAVRVGVEKMRVYTELKAAMFATAPYLLRPERARRAFHAAFRRLLHVHGVEEVRRVRDETLANFAAFERRDDTGDILKVGVCGDFYSTFLGRFPVFDLYEYLQDELGVEILEPLTWYNFHFADSPLLNPRYFLPTIQMLGRTMGGSDPITVLIGNYFTHQKVDGIIHLGVFACNPEVAAADVIHRYGKNHHFPPFLDVMFDEHTQPEAVKVRFEAFADMLRLNKGQSPLFDRTGAAQGAAA